MTAYLLSDGAVEVRADELLARAAAAQSAHSSAPRLMRLHSAEDECRVTSDASIWTVLEEGPAVTDATFCNSIAATLGAAGWAPHDLLSVETFQRWRAGLRDKTDAVEESADWVQVTTSTNEGPIRSASLRLQASDLSLRSARFELAAGGVPAFDVERSAEPPPAPFEPAAPLAEAPSSTVEPAIALTAESDPDVASELEAKARLTLHALDLDANVLLDVDRRLDTEGEPVVRIWGVVPTPEIKKLLRERTAGLSGVQVLVVSEAEQRREERPVPWDGFHEAGPALALDQVNALFKNDPHGRQRFLSELGSSTRALAGAARAREGLHALQAEVPHSELASELAVAAAQLDQPIAVQLERLSKWLQPLFDALDQGRETSAAGAAEPPDSQTVERLSYQEALEIYTLVCRLTLGASPQSGSSTDLARTRLEALLAGSR
ncbi:MAG: hypothetical protein GC160_12420 [Acidobacteria bacterium]|nr:hypothetical protein [Acidobacteriota bacterium]